MKHAPPYLYCTISILYVLGWIHITAKILWYSNQKNYSDCSYMHVAWVIKWQSLFNWSPTMCCLLKILSQHTLLWRLPTHSTHVLSLKSIGEIYTQWVVSFSCNWGDHGKVKLRTFFCSATCISYLTVLSQSSTVMIHCEDDEDVCRGTIKNYVCHIIVLLNKVHPGLRHYSSFYG